MFKINIYQWPDIDRYLLVSSLLSTECRAMMLCDFHKEIRRSNVTSSLSPGHRSPEVPRSEEKEQGRFLVGSPASESSQPRHQTLKRNFSPLLQITTHSGCSILFFSTSPLMMDVGLFPLLLLKSAAKKPALCSGLLYGCPLYLYLWHKFLEVGSRNRK